jgi:membrane-bound ClpP family serine protease
VRIWIVAVALLASTVGPIWWCISLVRCASRYQREHRGLLIPFLAFTLGASMMLKMCAVALNDTGEWMLSWYEEVTGISTAVRVIHDPVLGRLVLKGGIGLGSYRALKVAMEIKPKLDLIELDSPGGYVVEGLAMARLIRTNHMDTVSFDLCASACTLLLASGEDRYLGPDVEVGFHRSSSFGQKPSSSWNPTDYQIADYYRARGAEEDFIKKALDTPSFDLWIPEHGDMLKAGYANKLWSERKAGY